MFEARVDIGIRVFGVTPFVFDMIRNLFYADLTSVIACSPLMPLVTIIAIVRDFAYFKLKVAAIVIASGGGIISGASFYWKIELR